MTESSTPSTGPLKRFLWASRRRRDEAQFTQIIEGAAATDPSFSAGLAGVLVQAAPHGERLPEIPDELICTAELSIADSNGVDLGRVDLVFHTPDEEFVLLAELKLFSGYGDQQLERYTKALESWPSATSGLLAVTRDLPLYGEDVVGDDGRWLGSVRWRAVLEDLERLRHRDPHVEAAWRATLTLMQEQGDFGLMDFDRKAVEGWARWQEGRKVLITLLEEIYEPIIQVIREELGPPLPEEQRATAILHKNKRLVWPWGDSLNIQIAVPADNGERLRMQFAGARPEPVFTLEARHDDADILKKGYEEVTAATDRLRASGFETGRYWGAYWSRPHRPEEWLEEEGGPQAQLIELARKDLRDLIASGILDALAGVPEVERTLPPEEL